MRDPKWILMRLGIISWEYANPGCKLVSVSIDMHRLMSITDEQILSVCGCGKGTLPKVKEYVEQLKTMLSCMTREELRKANSFKEIDDSLEILRSRIAYEEAYIQIHINATKFNDIQATHNRQW